MFTHTNDTKQDLILPGIGVVQAGVTFSYPKRIENPNLTVVEESQEQTVVATEVPQAATVVNALPVIATEQSQGEIK